MGRKKINIEKIDNKKSRQVTFTKRRQGLFKKAADLCVLSDAKIGIVVFSATGNLFTFGHPSAEEVVNRFCNGTTPPTNDATAVRNSELVRSMRDTMSKIKSEKERLKKTKGDARGGFWWERVNFDELESMEELQDMENRLTNLRENVSNRINEVESSRKLMDCAENRAPLLICNDAWNVPAAAANSSHKCFENGDYFCPYWYGNPSSWPNLVNNNTLHGETLPIPGAYYYYG